MKYVSWDVVQGWRERVRSEGRAVEDAYPFAFASNDPAFRGFAGAVLWLVTLPRFAGYRLAPSLVARLDVARVADRDADRQLLASVDPAVLDSGSLVALARRDTSFYLPLNNVFHVLTRPDFPQSARPLVETYDRRDASREDVLGPYVSLAGHFQRHRWLNRSSTDAVERFAAAVRAGRRAFLSYRRADFPGLRDGPPWPERLGRALLDRDVSAWWDRWYLPQSDDGDEPVSPGLLEALLDDAVTQAAWFVALVGPGYIDAGDDSWPRREWAQAGREVTRRGRRHAMRRVIVFLSRAQEDELHRRWCAPSDTVLWVGAAPRAAAVAQAIVDVMSLDP